MHASYSQKSPINLAPAQLSDVKDIFFLLRSNKNDKTLYLRSKRNIQKHIHDFVLAKNSAGVAIGCAALKIYHGNIGEILSVCIVPHCQNQGIGRLLVNEQIKAAKLKKLSAVWISTKKPEFFSKLGFTAKNQPPKIIFVNKILETFKQPLRVIFTAISAQYIYMAYPL